MTAEADQGDRDEALQEREHLDVTGLRELGAERCEPLEPLVDVGGLGAGLHERDLHQVQQVPACRGVEAPEAGETAGAERLAHGRRRPSYLLEGVVLHPQLEERGGPLQPDQEAVDHDRGLLDRLLAQRAVIGGAVVELVGELPQAEGVVGARAEHPHEAAVQRGQLVGLDQRDGPPGVAEEGRTVVGDPAQDRPDPQRGREQRRCVEPGGAVDQVLDLERDGLPVVAVHEVVQDHPRRRELRGLRGRAVGAGGLELDQPFADAPMRLRLGLLHELVGAQPCTSHGVRRHALSMRDDPSEIPIFRLIPPGDRDAATM